MLRPILIGSTLLALACGCAIPSKSDSFGSGPSKAGSSKVGPSTSASLSDATPADRREQLVTEFEQRRNNAQLEAARARLAEGDDVEAEKLLESLLERNPRHWEACRLLADVYVAREQLDEAESLLQTLLDARPEDAAAWHSLGVLHELSGRAEIAADCFQKASELEPENPLYRVSRL